MRFAGIIRKSPTNKGVEESIRIQKVAITNSIKRDFPDKERIIDWFIDSDVSGDDPNRPELNKLFDNIRLYDYAYCHVVDRFSRSFMGLSWFNEYFLTDRGLKPHKGCKLRFCEGVGELYDDEDMVHADNYMAFFFWCGIAQAELMRIRKRTTAGRDKLRGTPEWKKKYAGRKAGSKNKKKTFK